MPRFDGTGPRGSGPFTGGGRGHCAIVLPPAGSAQRPYGYVGYVGTPAVFDEDMALSWSAGEADGQWPDDDRSYCGWRPRGARGGYIMPGRDHTGPRGEGAMTGWGAGDCAGRPAGAAGYVPRWGRRMGRRSRRGLWGMRRGGAGFWGGPADEPATPQQEVDYLEHESGWLQTQLNAVQERLAALKGDESE